MSSLTDYVNWYADLSFYDLPFNEVDNVVLCTLTYYDFDAKRIGERPTALRRCLISPSENDPFLRAVVESQRFGSLMVSDYVEVFSRDTSTQFAALTFHLYDDVYFVSFRGTDNSLVGWKEDFVMSYRKTEGQIKSVEYLNDIIRDDRRYILAGHSKGGNLALYGACHISDDKLSRVIHIYNNDGPGLCPEVSDVSLIDRIRDLVTVIHPRYCIFGKIFAHKFKDVRIVTSSAKGIMEHDSISWEVEHGKLHTVDRFDPKSDWINDIAEKWIQDVSPEEREALVKGVFSTAEARGAETYTEAMQFDIDGVEDLIVNVVESDSLKTVAKIPEKVLFGDMIARLRTGKLAKFIDANQLIEGIVFTVVGLLMTIFTDNAFRFIVIVALGTVVAFQFVYTIKKLREDHWNFVREKTRVYIFLVVATLFAVILVKNEALFIVGSGICGGWLLVVAYRSFLAFKQSEVRDFAFWKNFVKSILYSGCGIFIILAPSDMAQWFMLVLGGVMTIDGLSAIIFSFIEANEKYSRKYHNLKDKVRHKNSNNKKEG